MRVHVKVFLDRGRPLEEELETDSVAWLIAGIAKAGYSVIQGDFRKHYPAHRITSVETTVLPEEEE